MRPIQSCCWLSSLVVTCVVAGVRADDPVDARWDNWRQWRGPLGDGVAAEGNPPIQWSEEENIRWKASIPGQGSASPIIDGDQIFLLSAVKTDRTTDAPEVPRAAKQPEDARTQPAPTHVYQFKVFSVDKDSGRVRWERTAAEAVPQRGHHRDGGYACASPASDGERLYVCFGSQGVFCYDLHGDLLWSRDLGKMETWWDFGECVNPVVHDGTVILVYDQLGPSAIYGLDAKTGETRWRRDRDEQAGWSTPLLVTRNGETQLIRAGTNHVSSYDPATGRLLWQCAGLGHASVASPVATNDAVFCMTYFEQPSLLAVSLDSQGDVTDTDKVLWRYDRDTSYVPSPVIIDQTLYFLKDRTPILTGLNARTGEVVLPTQRLAGVSGKIYASPVVVGKRLYLTSRDGETLVLEKQGDRLVQLALNKLSDSFDASPAIVGDRIYLRGRQDLYCIERKAGGPE